MIIANNDVVPKFVLEVNDRTYKTLRREALDRGLTIQELVSVVVVPEWLKDNPEQIARLVAAR